MSTAGAGPLTNPANLPGVGSKSSMLNEFRFLIRMLWRMMHVVMMSCIVLTSKIIQGYSIIFHVACIIPKHLSTSFRRASWVLAKSLSLAVCGALIVFKKMLQSGYIPSASKYPRSYSCPPTVQDCPRLPCCKKKKNFKFIYLWQA